MRSSKKSALAGYHLWHAAKLARLSPVMVDYLCRSGVLVPANPGARGRGRKRVYSFGDVVMLRVIAKLLERGVSVARIKHALNALRQFHPEITPTSLPKGMLFTDGERVYLKDSKEIVEDLVRGQYAFAFVLELKSVRREVLDAEAAATQRKLRRSGT